MSTVLDVGDGFGARCCCRSCEVVVGVFCSCAVVAHVLMLGVLCWVSRDWMSVLFADVPCVSSVLSVDGGISGNIVKVDR